MEGKKKGEGKKNEKKEKDEKEKINKWRSGEHNTNETGRVRYPI